MLAQNEMDSQKLVRLIREINRVFETSEEREKKALSAESGPDVRQKNPTPRKDK
jgi:hypothetical protein